MGPSKVKVLDGGTLVVWALFSAHLHSGDASHRLESKIVEVRRHLHKHDRASGMRPSFEAHSEASCPPHT